MQRMWRSPLVFAIWWICAFIFVFAYIFFDLLDIDGSDLRAAMAGPRAAEERIVNENAGKHTPSGFVGSWSSTPRSFSVARGSLCTTLAPTSTVRRPSFLSRRPRALIATPRTASTQPEVDPSRRS